MLAMNQHLMLKRMRPSLKSPHLFPTSILVFLPVLSSHCSLLIGEKPFECRLCGQRSRDYSAMIKHLRTHGGAAPYQCTVCSEFCTSLVIMQRHIKSHAVQDFPPDWSINSTYLYTSHVWATKPSQTQTPLTPQSSHRCSCSLCLLCVLWTLQS